MVISLSRVTEIEVACSIILNQSFFCAKYFLQILRHNLRASDNQNEHSYIY